MNEGSGPALFRIEFQGLSARQTVVDPGDWWRMPITGRPDGSYGLVVYRAGAIILDTQITVACDAAPQTSLDEVQVVNACRFGNGYILFQFVNNTAATKGYVVEFDGVPNRSTSAAPHGASVRAVTGRPAGTYEARIRSGFEVIETMSVTVDCD